MRDKKLNQLGTTMFIISLWSRKFAEHNIRAHDIMRVYSTDRKRLAYRSTVQNSLRLCEKTYWVRTPQANTCMNRTHLLLLYIGQAFF